MRIPKDPPVSNVDLFNFPEPRPPQMALYGQPASFIPPLKPDLTSDQFKWPPAQRSSAPKPLQSTLSPPPAVEPPAGYTYPHAPEYTLSPSRDDRYTRGWAYTAPFIPSLKSFLRERLLCTKTPPKVVPHRFTEDGYPIAEPIPDMIQMPPGIPFTQHTPDNPDEAVTLACAQTPDSIRANAPAHVSQRVDYLCEKLRVLTFGGLFENKEHTPIYAIPGLKRNARSVSEKKLPADSCDGSYNLASTKGEGEGVGCFIPAVQASTPEARSHITSVLETLHSLRRLIMPLCLSKFEYDVTEAHSELNNIPSFGGLEPNGTSCQMNISSGAGGFDLRDFIGDHQGSWHTDIGDDWTRWTMMTLVLKVPPGRYRLVHQLLFLMYLIYRK